MYCVAHRVSYWLQRTHHSIVLADVLLKPLPLKGGGVGEWENGRVKGGRRGKGGEEEGERKGKAGRGEEGGGGGKRREGREGGKDKEEEGREGGGGREGRGPKRDKFSCSLEGERRDATCSLTGWESL